MLPPNLLKVNSWKLLILIKRQISLKNWKKISLFAQSYEMLLEVQKIFFTYLHWHKGQIGSKWGEQTISSIFKMNVPIFLHDTIPVEDIKSCI